VGVCKNARLMGFERSIIEVMSGTRTGAGASLLRGLLATAEPFYASAAALRNGLYDLRVRKSHRLARPVISIGNITTGGTGKTPMVRWLAARLRDEGRRVAVLSRGYKSAAGKLGDEQLMLDQLLNGPGMEPVIIKANPSRLASAGAALREGPSVDVFLLDDGFQHRAVARDLDIVLLNAAEPFGFDHVLPRGLLREPLRGLTRAGAIVITHCEQVEPPQVDRIGNLVRRYNRSVPIYRAAHVPIGLRSNSVCSAAPPDHELEELANKPFFAFAGIGSPRSFDAQLRAMGSSYVGHRWFADHHSYTPADLEVLVAQARKAGAQVLLTTEKDWVKIGSLPAAKSCQPPIWRLDVGIQFQEGDELRLLAQVNSSIDVGRVSTRRKF
jgi:tetraacyldisaccharide 4'-kinase